MIEMVYKNTRTITVLHSGEYRGLKFAILSLGTHPTAYVECPYDSINSYDDDRLDNINVHGGFTFFDEGYWSRSAMNTVFLGWDYAHYGDYMPCFEDYPELVERKWTTAEIFEEVKSVIDQLLGGDLTIAE